MDFGQGWRAYFKPPALIQRPLKIQILSEAKYPQFSLPGFPQIKFNKCDLRKKLLANIEGNKLWGAKQQGTTDLGSPPTPDHPDVEIVRCSM